MVLRIINRSLMLAIGVGVYLLIGARAEHYEVEQEYDRLIAKVGRFEITDPTKFHFAALPTDDPFEFTWRVFVPAGSSIELEKTDVLGGGRTLSMPASSEGAEILWGVYLRFTRENIQCFIKANYISTSIATPLKQKEFTKFLYDRRDELVVESMAKNGPVTCDTGQILTLLKIEIPEHLRAEASQAWTNGPFSQSKRMPVVHVRAGTAKAFAAAANKP